MKLSLKKTYIAVLGLLMTATAHVQGQQYYGPAGEYDSYGSYGSFGGDCCDYDQCSNRVDLSRWFIEAEYLYFRSSLCGLEPAFGRTAIDVSFTDPVTTVITERHREPDWEWDSGYRVGIGYSFGGCDNYDIQLYYTHVNGRAKPHHHHRDGSSSSSSSSSDEGFRNRGHWKLKYDVVDLTFGRRINYCQFMMRPFVGVRFAEIDQKLHSRQVAVVTSGGAEGTIITELNQKEKFHAVAPEVGLETEWGFCDCWSIYADFAFAPYYGDVKARNNDTDLSTGAVTLHRFHAKRCFNSVATDSAFGIRWNTAFGGCGCNNMTFGLKLGVEAHRIYDFSDLGSDGTLTMVGGTVSAILGF